jgi:DNA-binding SARP family transcriptional activator
MSHTLKITLFGKFNVLYGDEKIYGMQAHKVQEFFCYLLLSRRQPQSREALAELFWESLPPARSKKNLRQILWRLQCILNQDRPELSRLLLQTEGEWIQIDPSQDFSLDIDEFENIYNSIKGKRARELSPGDFKSIQRAVALYQGDLLEGWYYDWCVIERERLQIMLLMLLDKLIQYCEVHHEFDNGLAYGAEILRRDRAYERTHRQMMRLYYMAGDRTQAIHQYERCKAALQEELDVAPSKRTQDLYEQICADIFKPPLFALKKTSAETPELVSALNDVLDRLDGFSQSLIEIRTQVRQEIASLQNNRSVRE